MLILLALVVGAILGAAGIHLFYHEPRFHNAVSMAVKEVTPRPKIFGLHEASVVIAMLPDTGADQKTLLWFRSVLTGILGYKFTVAEEVNRYRVNTDMFIENMQKSMKQRDDEIRRLAHLNQDDGRTIEELIAKQSQLDKLAAIVDPPDKTGGVEGNV